MTSALQSHAAYFSVVRYYHILPLHGLKDPDMIMRPGDQQSEAAWKMFGK